MSWPKCVGLKKNPLEEFVKYVSFYLFRTLQGIKLYLSGHMQYLNA